jgi:hypothetical protein
MLESDAGITTDVNPLLENACGCIREIFEFASQVNDLSDFKRDKQGSPIVTIDDEMEICSSFPKWAIRMRPHADLMK